MAWPVNSVSFHKQPDVSSGEFPFALAHFCCWDNPGWFPVHPLYSGVLRQLSKCHESSGNHEFVHKHTPPTTALLHHSQVLLHLACWAGEFLCGLLSTPHPSARVWASHSNPSHCTSDQQSDFYFFVCIFRFISLCFPQRHFNRDGRKHQEQICSCQLAGNGLRFHRHVY